MTTYTTRQVAGITGKTLQAISRYAQTHEGVGKKTGRDWFFSESDLRRLIAVKRGGYKPRKGKAPRTRRAPPSPAPATAPEETTP